ncbi:nitrile hydratase accessory protein [Rhodanobacter aciditrophus]|uniref:Nitrile hydratase accessory protein n=1 Tax=Rhodanobacter aciditrophus TaxID=1623218 RepID=A0ABW4B2T7_9GAMM
MSQSENSSLLNKLSKIDVNDAADVTFEEPWQAQSFAVTVLLSKSGLFAWTEWVEMFAKHIADRPQHCDETPQQAYYRQWLSALESLLDSKGITSEQTRALYKEDWRRSYIVTEHGQPIKFQKGLPDMPNPHHHHHHSHGVKPKPISVSPAKK